MEIKKVTQLNDDYFCDIDITIEEWKNVLQDSKLMKGNYAVYLKMLYDEPKHSATCKAIGEKYNISPQSFNSTIIHFSRAVQKKLNRFQVIGANGKPVFWIIPMTGKYINEYFEWTMRPELVKAIKEIEVSMNF
jgi:predicted HNH restriction endonuclease